MGRKRSLPFPFWSRLSIQGVVTAAIILVFGLSTTYSFVSLKSSEQELRSLTQSDFKAISLIGDLAFHIQESRRRTLYVLAVKSRQERTAFADQVQEPDTTASIIQAQLTGLGFEGKISSTFHEFNTDWEAYEAVRDTIIQLGLQWRDNEALTLEATRGRPLFDAALRALNETKRQLQEAAAQRAALVELAFHRRMLRVAVSGGTALLLVIIFMATAAQHKRALRELNRSEELARTQEQWLQAVQDVGTIGIWEMGTNPDYIRYSPQELTLLGLPPDLGTFTMRDFDAMVHPDDRSQVFINPAGEPRQDFEREFRIRRGDGAERWILSRGTIVRTPEEQRCRLVGVHLDITDRKTFERELLDAKEKADAGTRAKSDFLATMSHELRTPLNGVVGMSSLLQQTTTDQLQKECVDIILQCSNSLVHVINDILDFSKLEARQMVLEQWPFSLSGLLHECAAALRTQVQNKGLALRVLTPSESACTIECDERRLKQVILNLLSNAVKFTEKGSIELSASYLSNQSGDTCVRIAVQDTGIGVPENLLATLFDRFTQADSSNTRKFGGTGLGLAISKQLVELMGGEISVESAPGLGSTFWFQIPLQHSRQQQSEEALAAA